jgi:hypothetical protein
MGRPGPPRGGGEIGRDGRGCSKGWHWSPPSGIWRAADTSDRPLPAALSFGDRGNVRVRTRARPPDAGSLECEALPLPGWLRTVISPPRTFPIRWPTVGADFCAPARIGVEADELPERAGGSSLRGCRGRCPAPRSRSTPARRLDHRPRAKRMVTEPVGVYSTAGNRHSDADGRGSRPCNPRPLLAPAGTGPKRDDGAEAPWMKLGNAGRGAGANRVR